MYNWIYENVFRKLDAEKCHNMGLKVLENRLVVKLLGGRVPCDKRLNVDINGVKFDNPLGMAAGFDKNGIVFHNLFRLGFGHVEIGTITLDVRDGNPKPRIWRTDDGLINRMGLPGHGVEKVISNIHLIKKLCNSGVVGANISAVGRDENMSDFTAVRQLYLKLKRFVDYITVNISCPNVEKNICGDIKSIIEVLSLCRHDLYGIPVFIKLAPDLEEDVLKSYLDLFMKYKIDGVVLGNTLPTTINGLNAGLSGPDLIRCGMRNISTAFEHTKGKLHIIGVGGVENYMDALEYIKCGASIVQIYTSFVKYGPRTPVKILNGILDYLDENQSVQDIRGIWV